MGVSAVQQRLTVPGIGSVVSFLAPIAMLAGTAFLPFAAVGSTRRSLLSGVQSGVRVGLLNSPQRVLGALFLLALPVGAFLLLTSAVAERLTGRRVTTRWLSVCVALLGLAAAAISLLGPSTPQSGAALTTAAAAVVLACERGRPVRGGTRASVLVGLGSLVAVGLGGITLFGIGLRSGSGSARGAAASFVSALHSGDNLSVLEQLDPYERAAVVERGPRLLNQLERLDVLQQSAALGGTGVRGQKPEVGQVAVLADGLAAVQVSGTVSVPALLVEPLGANVADAIRQPGKLVSVRRDGRWYVSILHTSADMRRVKFGRKLTSESIQPVGAPNPEAAVRDMFSAISAVDLTAFIALMDPEEMSVAYRYGPLLQPDVERLASWSETNARWTFPDMGLTSTVSGSQATIRVTRLSAQLDLPSDFGVGSSAVLNGNCVRVTVEQESARHCGEDIPQVIADLFGTSAPNLGELSWLRTPKELGEIVVVQRKGRWFVAPLRSAAATATVHLRTYDREDLQGQGNDLPSQVRKFADNPLVKLATGW